MVLMEDKLTHVTLNLFHDFFPSKSSWTNNACFLQDKIDFTISIFILFLYL
jgi:hypothetical protein